MTFPGSSTSTVSLPAEEFSIASEVRHGCRILSVRGDLDDLAAPDLDIAIGEHSDAPAVVDLSGLSFIDSAGMHVLLRERRGGIPAVVCPSGHVSRVLEIVDAGRTTRVFEDVDAALEAVTGGRVCERGEARGRRRSTSIWLSRTHEKRSSGRA